MIDMLDADDGMPFEEKKKSLQRFLAETRQSLLGSDLPNFDNNEKEECKNSIE